MEGGRNDGEEGGSNGCGSGGEPVRERDGDSWWCRWCKGARSLSATVDGLESHRLKGQKEPHPAITKSSFLQRADIGCVAAFLSYSCAISSSIFTGG